MAAKVKAGNREAGFMVQTLSFVGQGIGFYTEDEGFQKTGVCGTNDITTQESDKARMLGVNFIRFGKNFGKQMFQAKIHCQFLDDMPLARRRHSKKMT